MPESAEGARRPLIRGYSHDSLAHNKCRRDRAIAGIQGRFRAGPFVKVINQLRTVGRIAGAGSQRRQKAEWPRHTVPYTRCCGHRDTEGTAPLHRATAPGPLGHCTWQRWQCAIRHTGNHKGGLKGGMCLEVVPSSPEAPALHVTVDSLLTLLSTLGLTQLGRTRPLSVLQRILQQRVLPLR